MYWVLGMMLLPEGEFSRIGDIADQYKNCKKTEDIDMTCLDFITDHIIDIDGIFDKHQNGDAQKPHKALQTNHHNHFSTYFSSYKASKLMRKTFVDLIVYHESFDKNHYFFRFSPDIFRPPLA